MVSLPQRLLEVELSKRDRIVVYYLTGLVLLVLFYTVVYNLAMARLEGVNQSIYASFEFVVQTMTTTGYGQDSGLWNHPLMFLFVAMTQITGIAIGFFTLRLIIIPLFTGAEVNLDNRLTPKQDHVIICEYRRDSAVLLDELRELDIEYVLISSSRENAEESGIYEQTGCRVIAVEDESGLTSTIDPQRRFTGDERIILVGPDEAVQRFLKRFDVSPMEAEV